MKNPFDFTHQLDWFSSTYAISRRVAMRNVIRTIKYTFNFTVIESVNLIFFIVEKVEQEKQRVQSSSWDTSRL